MLKICAWDSPWLSGQALQHIAALAMQEERGGHAHGLPFAARSAGTALLWSHSCHHTRGHHLSPMTRPKLFSKAQFFNICWFSSQKEKGSVPYFSKINAIVKSWQKIRATTALSKTVTRMNLCKANFYFKDNHPTPVMAKTKYRQIFLKYTAHIQV